MLSYNDSVIQIKGVGEKTAATLKKLGIETVSQLISYYPRDYECFAPPIDSVSGQDGIQAICLQITGRVNTVTAGRWQIVTATGKMQDGTLISLKWFNMAFLRYTLKPGFQAVFRGK